MLSLSQTPHHPLLAAYQAEGEALRERVKQALEADEALCAAWLFGSLGRGEADPLSDLDLFLVVPDALLEARIQGRHAYMSQFGKPLLILEAPQNAPLHGAYNMALYDGELGPHQIDWYWQAQSHAIIPQQTLLFYDRVGLPHSEAPPHFDYQPVPERTPLEAASQAVSFFWVMLFISAKYIFRSPNEDKMSLIQWVLEPLTSVQTFLGQQPTHSMETLPVHPTPNQKLLLLHELAATMVPLMPPIASQGGHVPQVVVPSVLRYLDFITTLTSVPPLL